MKFLPVPITGGPTNGKRVLFSVWETRVQDYEAFVKATNHTRKHAGFVQGPTHPAVTMTWDEVMNFCRWLTDQERRAGRINMEESYRLPFDHEWSCAVGIGSSEDPTKSPAQKTIDGKFSALYPWGTSWPPTAGTVNFGGEELGDFQEPNQKVPRIGLAGHRDGFPRTSPVGSFPADGPGLFDLGGNASTSIRLVIPRGFYVEVLISTALQTIFFPPGATASRSVITGGAMSSAFASFSRLCSQGLRMTPARRPNDFYSRFLDELTRYRNQAPRSLAARDDFGQLANSAYAD